MSGASVERAYSVAVEMTDGSAKTVRVSGKSPSEVYAAVRAMPGVRRVGKVVEAGKGGHDATHASHAARPGQQSAQHGAGEHHAKRHGTSSHRAVDAEPAAATVSAAAGGGTATLGLSADSIRGPRVVRHHRSGGELPFKHLKAPPGRTDSPHPPPPGRRAAARLAAAQAAAEAKAAAEKAAAEAAAAEAAAAQKQAAKSHASKAKKAEVAEGEAEEAAPGRAYRIVKSRRKDGLPYLLQRGTWRQQGDRRVFDSEWEKGFQEREKAEKHLNWLTEMEQDHAALDAQDESHEE